MADPLIYLPLVVVLVQRCPENKVDWLKASKRLNCSIDSPDNTNLYHCVPSEDLSTLLEFCFDSKRIGVQKGSCVELRNTGILNPINCSTFQSGCPRSFYFSNEIYKYPACLKVNFQQRCFFKKNDCVTLRNTSNSTQETTTNSTETSFEGKHGLETGKLLLVVFTASLSFMFLSAFIFYMYLHRRRPLYLADQSGENVKENPEATNLLNKSQRDFLESSLLSGSHPGTPLLRPESSQKETPSDFQKDLFLKAAEDGKRDEVQSYIESNYDLNVVNSNNQTALHLVSRNGYTDTVVILIENDANVNIIDKEGKTALYYAVESNNSEIVEQLLNCDNTEIDLCGEDIVSPLCKAVMGKCSDIIEMLSLKGANIFLQKLGLSPILEAVSNVEEGNTQQEIVELLFRNSGNVCNKAGESVLHIAIKNKNKRFVELFLDVTNINLCDKQKRSPLFVASHCGNRFAVNMLLERHAKVNELSLKGDSALHVALRNNHLNIAKKLLKCGAKPRLMNREKETPLNIACTKGDTAFDIVKSLVNKHGVKVNADDSCQAVSPLYSALRREGNDIRKFLVSKGATLNAEEIGQALVRAARHGFVQNVKFLLPLAKEINNGKYSKYSDETPLHAAVKGDHEKIVYLLIERGVDVNVKDPDDKSPLHYAKSLNIVKELVTKGAIVNAEDISKRTPLFEASTKEITKYLCEKGADVNATSRTLWTPLHEACYKEKDNVKIIKYLVDEKYADTKAKDERSKTPLHAAAEGGNFEVVKTLINSYSADINAADKNGGTPLHEAVLGGHRSIVKYLLDYEANVDAADKDNRTPLHHAAMKGNTCIVQYLLEKNANVFAKDINDKTAGDLTQNQGIKDLLQGQ